MELETSITEIRYLITGAAGFIRYFLSKRLLEQGHIVIGTVFKSIITEILIMIYAESH